MSANPPQMVPRLTPPPVELQPRRQAGDAAARGDGALCGDGVRARWLPDPYDAAVTFSIDDVHPGRSSDAYEAGGDLGNGALGHVAWLLERHPRLRVTLFTAPDWRELAAFPTRRLLARIPRVRDRVMLAPTLPRGRMRLDRHPGFVAYLRELPRTEIGLHGLHHVNRGTRIPVEFHGRGLVECVAMLREGIEIFEAAGLPPPRGMAPPGWEVSEDLATAMAAVGLEYVASARDLITPVGADATTAMSGLWGVPLLHPALVFGGRLVHVPSNFSATSPLDRALDVVAAGGLVSIKAHIVKVAFGHIMLDGIDALYRNYLDVVLSELEDRFGDRLWFATMAEVAERARIVLGRPAALAGGQ